MAEAIDSKTNSIPTKVTGENEQHCADVTSQKDLTTADILNNGGLDVILSIIAGTPKELKVGALVKTNRKYVIMEALDTGIKWGFSNTTQSFDLFKSQLIMLPVGDLTQVWFDCDNGTKQVAIGEL